MITTVWAYVNTIKQLGDPKHIKVFATTDTAETRFAGTTEGVALRVRGFGIRPATEAAYPLRGASRGGYGECEVSSSQGGP